MRGACLFQFLHRLWIWDAFEEAATKPDASAQEELVTCDERTAPKSVGSKFFVTWNFLEQFTCLSSNKYQQYTSTKRQSTFWKKTLDPVHLNYLELSCHVSYVSSLAGGSYNIHLSITSKYSSRYFRMISSPDLMLQQLNMAAKKKTDACTQWVTVPPMLEFRL